MKLSEEIVATWGGGGRSGRLLGHQMFPHQDNDRTVITDRQRILQTYRGREGWGERCLSEAWHKGSGNKHAPRAIYYTGDGERVLLYITDDMISSLLQTAKGPSNMAGESRGRLQSFRPSHHWASLVSTLNVIPDFWEDEMEGNIWFCPCNPGGVASSVLYWGAR